MSQEPTRGLYEALITDALQAQLAEAGEAYHVERAVLDATEAPDRYALHLARVIERALRGLDPKTRVQAGAVPLLPGVRTLAPGRETAASCRRGSAPPGRYRL